LTETKEILTHNKFIMKKTLTFIALLLFVGSSFSQTVIISEVADGTGAGGYPKIVELTNTGSSDAVLDGMKLRMYANGSPTPAAPYTIASFTLPAGQSLVLTNMDNTTAGQLWSDFNLTAPTNVLYSVGAVNSNGDDVYELLDATDSPVDVYGVIGVDGTGTTWEFLDSYAYRNNNITNGNTTFTESEWTFAGVDFLDPFAADLSPYLTPGIHVFNPSTAPVISNIYNDPSSPGSSTAVSIYADVVAQGTASLTEVKVSWGTESGVLSNEIIMTVSSGDTYVTSTQIPAQPESTTVYYMVHATDNDMVSASSVELSYFIGNLPPSFAAILTNPALPNETQTVEVSANITDDGTIVSAVLMWGLDGITFDNNINMVLEAADNYVTETQIPAQTAGTTVYFHILATDNDALVVSSDTLQYTTTIAPGSFVFQNGGFELWTDFTPDFWTTIDVGIEVAEETGIIYEGEKSAKITLITDNQANADIRQTVSVFAGHSYNFDVMVYQTDTFARARIFAGDFQGYSDPMIIGEWQLISYSYVAEIDADIEVGLRFYDRPGFSVSSVFYVDGMTMNDITNVNLLETTDFSIYPNPANNFLNIKGKNIESAQIFTITGQSITQVSVINNQIDISTLKQGIYLIKLNGVETLRFIKE
jgi:hypothetical protein